MPWLFRKQCVHRILALAAVVGLPLALIAAKPAGAAEGPPNNEQATVERALDMLKHGADGREVVALVEPLAFGGNGRAQLLLGAIHVDGKNVPRDMIQGHAWLQVASTAVDPAVANPAKKALLTTSITLSGGDLIRADQRAAAIRATVAEHAYARYGAGLRSFTMERPISFSPRVEFEAESIQLLPVAAVQSNPNVRLGCAAAANRGCPSKSRAVESPRCTGRIVRVDSGPGDSPGAETYIVQPEIPVKLRRLGSQGTTRIVVHVDSSGWICGAAVAESSGAPSWDEEALRAVTLWRLGPATRRGEPVESLFLVSMLAKARVILPP